MCVPKTATEMQQQLIQGQIFLLIIMAGVNYKLNVEYYLLNVTNVQPYTGHVKKLR